MSTISNQLRMNMLNTTPEITHSKISAKNHSIETSQEKKEEIFAKDGDFKYDKAMDYNDDGVVTYDEYMRYCEENAVSQYTENPAKTIVQKVSDTSGQVQSIRPLNIGKALNIYLHSEQVPLEATVESEA